jgi:uncharacterized protein involved in type VI secretion and phage assembly
MDADVLRELVDWIRTRYFGKYRGVVTDTEDPTRRGRLRVRVPAVLDTLEVWAMPCVPYAGDGVGFFALPPVGSGVWVEFEGGDPSFPIWAGCFWADGEAPGDATASVKVWTTGAFTIRVDDDAGTLEVEKHDGSVLTVADDITNESGGSTLTIGSGGVTAEAGASRSELSNAGFDVNNGALNVV